MDIPKTLENHRGINMAHAGALLASANKTEQVGFFKAFVKGCNSWGTKPQIEMQLAWINLGLTPEEQKTLSIIGYTKDDNS